MRSATIGQRLRARATLWGWMLRPPRLFSGLYEQPLYRGMLLDWALPGIQPGQHVLELACAGGDLSAALSAHGARVLAVDRSAAMVALTRHRAPQVQTLQADAMQLPTPAIGFDHVLAASLLNLLDDRPGLLAAMASQAHPGGRIAVLVPDAAFDAPSLNRLLALHEDSSALEQAALRTWYRLAPKLSARTLRLDGARAGLPEPRLRPLLGGMAIAAEWRVP